MACVGRFVLERAVDSDRQFMDANASWRRACERWLEGRYHRFPCGGFQSLDSAALYARNRGAAHFGRIRVHGGWSVVFAEGQALRFCDENRAHWRCGRHRRVVRDDCDGPCFGGGGFGRAAHEIGHDGRHV